MQDKINCEDCQDTGELSSPSTYNINGEIFHSEDTPCHCKSNDDEYDDQEC